MTALPAPTNSTAAQVIAWRERTTDQAPRPHLGASVIGHECARRGWYAFRWCDAEQFDGRMLRLFDTGKREEPRVHEELRGIGCEVWADDGGAQYRFSALGGHFGGSVDGVVQGLPEAPKAFHVLEVKTHNAKAFKALASKGVKVAKPVHYAQMQVYMLLSSIDRSLYYAVCKDTDDLHIERVHFDKEAAEALLEKARRIITATEPPLRLSDDPEHFECKWCPFQAVCHGSRVPMVNCRTCAHATPVMDGGGWECEQRRQMLSLPTQRTGCEAHLYIPPLLAALGEPVDGDSTHVVYQATAGGQFTNGPAPGYSSAEIRAAELGALTDPTVQAVKAAFPTARLAA